MLYSCANIGRPGGGPRDVLPPVYVSSTPEPNQLNYTGEKVTITFDEYIKLEDQNTKVVVSPAQKNMPTIRSNGKTVTVELRDSLLPNTTYCIDFANAIQDNNEGNALQNFALAFSTGDSIDSLQISGIMLRAKDLEPMQSVVVGVHEVLHDSAFSSTPLTRIARTNDVGQFTIRNMKPGRYHVFGLNDMDGNYTFSRNEDMAFLDEIVVPSSYQRETTDTVFKYNGEIDTIVPGVHTVFTPNDVLLSMFNENYSSLYLKKDERPNEGKLFMLFSAPADTLPDLRLLKPQPTRPDWYRLEHTVNNDSLIYWITDSALIKSDSILVEARFLISDSLDNHVMTTDTINFFYRHREGKKKDNKKEERKGGGLLGKLLGGGENQEETMVKPTSMFDSIPTLTMRIENSLDYGDTLKIAFDTPIDSINPAGFHLFEKIAGDTVWNAVTKPFGVVPVDSITIKDYMITYPLEAGNSYRLDVDSLSIYDCYMQPNRTAHSEIQIPSLEEYANLYMMVNVNDSAFVELLDQSEKVVKTASVIKGQASFENIRPGTYYARIILDANCNGKWDTGNYARHLQPEEVYYYPNKIVLRKNWDNEQNWNIYERALDKQKPFDIKKNRSDAEIKRMQEEKARQSRQNGGRLQDDDEDEEDAWGVNQYSNSSSYTGNAYNDARTVQSAESY